jgi:hypothetical protein
MPGGCRWLATVNGVGERLERGLVGTDVLKRDSLAEALALGHEARLRRGHLGRGRRPLRRDEQSECRHERQCARRVRPTVNKS